MRNGNPAKLYNASIDGTGILEFLHFLYSIWAKLGLPSKWILAHTPMVVTQ